MTDLHTGNNQQEESTTIVAVDDDVLFLELLSTFLRRNNYTCLTASDGETAKAVIKKVRPDLVLVDGRMPVISGFDLCMWIKEVSDTPVIMITAYEDAKSVDKAFEAGAEELIAKPINWAILRQRIRLLLQAEKFKEERTRLIADLTQKEQDLSVALDAEKQRNLLYEQFVAMVSHEFRNPLAIIDMAAQRMERWAQRLKPEDMVKLGDDIRTTVLRLTDLIESCLTSARIEAGKLEYRPAWFNFADFLQKLCDRQQKIARSHKFRPQLDEAPEKLYGDDRLLDLVFSNLLTNAVKYSPKSKFVDITSSRCEGFVEITVRDYGLGIPEDEQPKMLERFFRSRTSSGISGTGLGLHLAHQLVVRHGGKLGFVSKENEGSSFTVKLPLGKSEDGLT